MSSITLAAVKGCTSSADEVSVTFATKYTSDLTLRMPLSCMKELMLTLQDVHQGKDDPEESRPDHSNLQPNQVSVKVPKKWMVTADLIRSLVILIMDYQSEAQVGFALDASAATQLANALTKNGEAVSQSIPISRN